MPYGSPYSDADVLAIAAALIHAARHQVGGADEISVAGLSGELADDQPPKSHGIDKHTDVTRDLFIPAYEGHALTGVKGTHGYYSAIDGGANLSQPIVYFSIKVPDDFVSFSSLKAVWLSTAVSGNAFWRMQAQYAAAAEAYNTHSDGGAYGTTATGGADIINVQEPANPLTLASLAKGDYIGIEFSRLGSNAEDTLDANVRFIGLLFTYTAEQ